MFGRATSDTIPIEILLTKDGKAVVSRGGLYYHDTTFKRKSVPDFIEDKDAYLKDQENKLRTSRRYILTNLLQGNDVFSNSLRVTNGHYNNSKDRGNVLDRHGISMGTAKIAVSRDNGRLYLNNNGTIAGVKSITAGAVFANTNKTINGDEAWARLDPTKLTAEHAEILWDALVTRYSKNKGSMAAFPDERVEGLNVSEVISLLALFGEKKTNVDYENNKKRGMPEHLRNKTLFVHSGRDLTFGTTKVNLHEDNIVKHDKDKKDFITWATTNKNYSIPIAIKPMGIELNAPLKRTFKIGSWENKADAQGQFPTLAQFLINTPVDGKGRFAVVSDLQEFEDTGSAFVRPNLLLGNSISDIKVKKADKNKIKTPIKTKESTKRVKAVARVKEKKPITGVIELRDLPVGSQYTT